MEHLWAPWRNAYVIKKTPTPEHLFREIGESSQDEENFVLVRCKSGYAVLNRFPYNAGHSMVVPYREVSDLDDLSSDELMDLFNLLKKVKAAMKSAFYPDGFNLGINLGEAAGAGVAQHLHIHLVPRWKNDANFMTSTAECRIHPSDLSQIYQALRPYLG